MIIGIGNDIIEHYRIERACRRDAFLSYTYTEKEMELIRKNMKHAAGNWCVKEAVAKVLGTGFNGIGIKEIEVLRDESGKPYVRLYGKAEKRAEELAIKKIFVSISDTKEYVTAVAIAEG